MKPSDQDLLKQFQELSNDQLMEVIATKREQYTEAAISCAEQVLRDRDVSFQSRVQLQESSVSAAVVLRTRWLPFYIWGIVPLFCLSSIAAIWVHCGSPYPSVLLPVLFVIFGSMALALVVGLTERRLWAWRLNWIFLAYYAIAAIPAVFAEISRNDLGTGILLAAVKLVFVLGNVWYFRRRRILFS